MPYRSGLELRIGDLERHERLAFGAILHRMMLSNHHPQALGAILETFSADFGEEDFWAMVDRAVVEGQTAEQTQKLAASVVRAAVRDLIYVAASEVAMAGTASGEQLAALAELRQIWGVEERKVPAGYRD
jgi:hypothetical protein